MSETAKIKNLWGDLPVGKNIRTPYIILKEQASLLTEATNGLLVGSVKRTSVDKRISFYKEYDFECNLEIKVPSLNNYSISIVQVLYPINIYPSKIISQATKDIAIQKCQTEEDLDRILEKILSSEQVRRIISGLLSEVRSDIEKKH